MQNFFAQHRIQPFTVVYEDFVTTYEETAREILHYLNIPFAEPLTFGERRLVRQADQTTEEWVRRYQELQQTSKRDGEYLAYMP